MWHGFFFLNFSYITANSGPLKLPWLLWKMLWFSWIKQEKYTNYLTMSLLTIMKNFHTERERGGGKKERCIGYVISLNLGTPNFRYIELITAWNFSLGKKNSPRAGLCCGISNILKNPNGHSCFLGYPLGVEWKGRKPGSGLLVR